MHRWCGCPRSDAVISRVSSLTAKMTANIATATDSSNRKWIPPGRFRFRADIGESRRTSSPRSSKPRGGGPLAAVISNYPALPKPGHPSASIKPRAVQVVWATESVLNQLDAYASPSNEAPRADAPNMWARRRCGLTH